MTNDEMRIAIAEACPAVCRQNLKGEYVWITQEKMNQPFDPPNDLNAMHEAEKTIRGTNKELEYLRQLKHVACPWCDITNKDNQTQHVFATAAQRAEAYLKTIGKYKESIHMSTCRKCNKEVPSCDTQFHDAWELLCNPCYYVVTGKRVVGYFE